MTAIALFDGRGARMDLLVRAGSDMPQLEMAFSEDDGTPVDMTGCTVDVAARTRGDAPVAMAMTTAFVGSSSLGVVTLDFAMAEVDRMEPPVTLSSPPKVGGDWTMTLVSAGGIRTPLLWGEIRIAAGSDL